MDSIHVHTVKASKSHATQRHRQIRKITSLFRIIEICVVLILISRFSSQFSGEYFREFSVVLFSPRFVFVIGNAIVITLFVKSGQFSSKDGDGKNSSTDLYDEFIEKSEKNGKIGRDEIENQSKQSVFEETRDAASIHDSVDMKIYRRSRSSENLKREKEKQSQHVLRRSVTEKIVEVSYPEDGMSNEEFRRTVEAFIERQQKLRREEDTSVFVDMSADMVVENTEESQKEVSQELKEKKLSWQKLQRNDSLDIESVTVHGHGSKDEKWRVILQLAFQSLGIVYGDIGTSPLYVYSSTFSDGTIKHNDDILGVLSLIFYTLTLIPLIKYVFVVLRANDNGNGGTFALYSLICRYAKVGLIPSQQAEDRDVSNYKLELPNNRQRRASILKSKLEKSQLTKYFLLLATMLGTSMVIGDGVLTPCISVLSAVGGIKEATSSMTEDRIVWISVAILVCLFMVQRFGTDKVGYSFAPIICIWFALIGGIGVYNFIKFDPTVVKALNPRYIIDYFRKNKKQAWISLGGVILCTTGAEALFADVGHFTVRSIQISMCSITYPALVLAYVGQASFLRKHNSDVADTFFKSIPGPLYWPMFVVAVLAAIIASQAMISGTFSIIKQSQSLGCFPRVKIVHTSAKYEGQVFIPEINYLLMLACVGVTVGFRTTTKIGNAYGIAVVFVMTLTSSLLILVMIMIWKSSILFVISYVLIIGTIELLYLSSVLYKFDQGGYLPLAFALVLMTIMYIWNDVYRRKYHYELDHKISPEKLKEVAANTHIYRIPGLAIFYSELVQGIPPIFKHYVENVPALHSVLVFVSIKSLHLSKVPVEERFLFRRVEPHELNVFRCVVRYGYTDVHNEQESFEEMLFERLKEFVRKDFQFPQKTHDNDGLVNEENHNEEVKGVDAERQQEAMEREIDVLDKAREAGVVHLIGESEVVAEKEAGIGKRILINHAYNFLKRNVRQSDKVFDIPHKRMLKVGMTYEL